jgi:hypothetical protein
VLEAVIKNFLYFSTSKSSPSSILTVLMAFIAYSAKASASE